MVDAGFITVGSDVGADAYVWGNGVLGQLGIGRRGTSKGRLFPTLNSSLHQQFPQGIVDVAAGANFTVTVTISGAVFSFGHAEYNQHGKGYQSYSDYTDPFYYFEPRQVNIESQLQSYRWEQSNDNEPAKPQVFMKRVVCGTVFSVGIDANGDIYSWGWNESGVLGHGYNHFASAPSRIEAIGTHADAQMVTAIAAGGKHILCLTGSYGDPWAKSYRTVLEFPLYYDCALVVPDTQQTLPCHLALLSARCPYLKGFIRAASEQHNCDRKIVQIELPSTAANAVTLRSLMNYIYMDRAQIANHKKRELLQLAEDLHLSPLIRIMTFTKDDNTKSTSLSTFTADIKKIFNNQEYADLLLVVSPDATLIGSSASSGSVETLDTEGIVEVQGLRKLSILYAHKAVVHHIPYFETLFTGNFADSSVYIDKSDGSGRKIQIVDMDGFIMDGIDTDTLLKVFSYAYTGQFGLYSNAGIICKIVTLKVFLDLMCPTTIA